MLAGVGDAVEAEDLHRITGDRLSHALAAVVDHRADATRLGAGHDRLADAQRAALDQHGDDRAAARIELGLDDDARGLGGRVGLELLELGDDQDRVEQILQVGAGLGRDVDVLGLATPLRRLEAELRELGAHPRRVRPLLVDLVDGDDDRDVGRVGVVDGLVGLRARAVVGGDHDHGDVRHPGAAGTHGGERLVARGVQEGDGLAVVMDLVGADVLRDATGLAGGDLGLADRVQQRRLAVVDMTHDRHDRRALDEILVGVVVLDLDIGVVAQRDDLDRLVERVGDGLDLLIGQRLGDHRQHAHGHELLDDVRNRDAEVLGDVLDRRAGVDPDRVDPRQLIGGQHVRRVRHRRAAATPTATRRTLRRRAGARAGTATGGLGVDDDAALAGAGAAFAAHPATRGTTGLARGLGLRLVALGALGRLGDRDDARTRAGRGRLDVRDQPGRLLVLAVLALGGRGALGVGGHLGVGGRGSLRLGDGRLSGGNDDLGAIGLRVD